MISFYFYLKTGCTTSEVAIDKTEIPLSLIKKIQDICNQKEDPYFDLKQCLKQSHDQWKCTIQCEKGMHTIVAQQKEDGNFDMISFE